MKNQWIDKHRQKIRDYILLMFGAPVVTIELDESQLDHAIDSAHKYMEKHSAVGDECLLQDGAYYHAMVMLGHVRGKFGMPAMANHVNMIEPAMLVKEGLEWLDHWKEEIRANP
jgi:hypothetical protein